MAKQPIGFTVSSPASQGHRRNWLGIESWKWSKIWDALKRQRLVRREGMADEVLMRFAGYAVVAVGLLIMVGIIATVARPPLADSAQWGQSHRTAQWAQEFRTCVDQTQEAKVCKAAFLAVRAIKD